MLQTIHRHKNIIFLKLTKSTFNSLKMIFIKNKTQTSAHTKKNLAPQPINIHDDKRDFPYTNTTNQHLIISNRIALVFGKKYRISLDY